MNSKIALFAEHKQHGWNLSITPAEFLQGIINKLSVAKNKTLWRQKAGDVHFFEASHWRLDVTEKDNADVAIGIDRCITDIRVLVEKKKQRGFIFPQTVYRISIYDIRGNKAMRISEWKSADAEEKNVLFIERTFFPAINDIIDSAYKNLEKDQQQRLNDIV